MPVAKASTGQRDRSSPLERKSFGPGRATGEKWGEWLSAPVDDP
jgi:hypothetical protein